MNNYYNYQDYMNQVKQNLQNQKNNMMMPNQMNQNKVSSMNPNIDDKAKGLYTPYEGFIRGNMFKVLYDPYKTNMPYQIRPMNEQAEMLTTIDALCFAMIDLNLYLDNHPDDRGLISLYNEYRKQNEQVKNEYEKKFGPLTTNSEAMKGFPWVWTNKPWPWENM